MRRRFLRRAREPGTGVAPVLASPVAFAAARVPTGHARLVFGYLTAAAAWLIVGTLLGLLEALRFQRIDLVDGAALSFGRARPLHVDVMLFGWTSLALLGLSLDVVANASRTSLRSVRVGWVTLALWNAGLLAGCVAIAAGSNHGGQEYRELPLPAALLLVAAVALHAWNLYGTLMRRNTERIYISSWFALSACLLTLVVLAVGYAPGLHRGVSQVIVQGYYMHNVIGMWFTPLALAVAYYVLPKALNKPIHSYALGLLGFWTHVVFYTLIGVHHYVFSVVPDWLEVTAIVFSVGMLVPVWASTGNFLLTLRGERSQIRRSVALPFLLAGAVAYGLSGLQGVAQALRGGSRAWHFTAMTVGHSHLSMAGFVSLLVWGGVYELLPRVTGRPPLRRVASVHLWVSLVGLAVMVAGLGLGGHEQGRLWAEGRPFLDSVRAMEPYWLWRTVGGGAMAIGHALFVVNLFAMRPLRRASSPPPRAAGSFGRGRRLDADPLRVAAFPLAIFVALTLVVAVIPAASRAAGGARGTRPPPEPHVAALVAEGRRVFVEEGCVACHTQQVRAARSDASALDLDARFGPATTIGEIADDEAPLLGTERIGPDLARIGDRMPNRLWHHLHLVRPRDVTSDSVMPSYARLYLPPDRPGESPIPTARATALVEYLVHLRAPKPPPEAPR